MLRPSFSSAALSALALVAFTVGCTSPYRSDQGALAGGLAGAGLGAVVGHAVGNTGAGAAIGAATGALSGAAVGASLDNIEARNQAEIAARLGHPAPTGSVTMDDVISMSRAGVSEDVIVNHIHNHGAAAPLRASDLIVLQQQGVSPRVVQALQAPPPAAAYPPPQPVYGPAYYGPPGPYWGPPPYPYYYRPYPSFGFVIRR
jgi:outer membrane lipoprotein SlyB